MEPKLHQLLTDLHTALGRFLGVPNRWGEAPAEPPPIQKPKGILATLEFITARVAREYDLEPSDLRRKYGPNSIISDHRRVAMYFAWRYHQGSIAQLASFFAVRDGYHTCTLHVARLKDLMDVEPHLRDTVEKLQTELDALLPLRRKFPRLAKPILPVHKVHRVHPVHSHRN